MNRKIIFAERLSAARTAKGWTKQALADRLGVSDVLVGYWEHGSRWPSIETLISLAETLEVSTDWLLAHSYPSSEGGEEH